MNFSLKFACFLYNRNRTKDIKQRIICNGGYKQKEFLISVIEKAIEEVEAEMKPEDESETEFDE